ncbi:hypothetical protein EYC98_20815 [Halieaceae bacterium IMCC14734]|uniref:Sulphotransferase Stf0 domain-containing protein n=1 Tax=Candidatus Litorirhabdus singularis TaxID=2518993 RepID=A0ABT3TNK2_9GAMM|nr:hypothetical protein [Candidatus Litorirhabdus singularis]MCX2983311.1 hypothetical protein [Candidatus Litorirhabdus singularis]
MKIFKKYLTKSNIQDQSGKKKPTIYFHFGMAKAASSSIQFWLNNNREILVKNGVLYPDSFIVNDAHYAFSSLFNFGPREVKDKGSKLEELSSLVNQYVDTGQYKAIVWSSEFFSGHRDISELKDFFSDFNCRIIIYLRRHDYWWQSKYAQDLKFPSERSHPTGLKAYIDYQVQLDSQSLYATSLDELARVFGRENLIVRPLEQEQMPKGLIVDFLNIIGVKTSGLDIGTTTINKKMSNQANYILDHARISGIARAEYGRLSNYLQKNDPFSDRSPLFSPEERLSMLEHYQRTQYDHIAKTYLGRADGTLFFSPLPQSTVPWQPPELPETEEIIRIIAASQRGGYQN